VIFSVYLHGITTPLNGYVTVKRQDYERGDSSACIRISMLFMLIPHLSHVYNKDTITDMV